MFIYLPLFKSVGPADHTSEMTLFIEIKGKNIRPASTDDVLILLLLTLFFETFNFANARCSAKSIFL